MAKLLLWAVLAIPAWAAEPSWIRVATNHFEVLSSAPETDARRTLRTLERVKAFFDQEQHAGIRPRASRVRVVIFASKKEYNEYRFQQFAAGYSAYIDGQSYIVLSAAENEVLPTAIHEYVHLMAQEPAQRLSPWLSEGIAEFFSTLKFTGEKVAVGLPPAARVQALERDTWVPLAEVLNADHDSPFYSQTGMSGILYNEGWALVHMLEFSPRYSPSFAAFLQEAEKGTASKMALEKIYGKPLTVIERELKSYLRHGYYATRVTAAPPSAIRIATAQPAAMFDVHLALLDLASRLGKTAETRAGLERLMREDPRRPEPQVALGYLLIRNYREQEAFPFFETAVTLGSRNPQMLWDYGRLAAATRPAQAMAALKRLLDDQPGRSDARVVLAEIQMSQRRPREALETLAPVSAVTPDSAVKFQEILTLANLELENRNVALEHARNWLAASHDGTQKVNAGRIVRYLEDSLQ